MFKLVKANKSLITPSLPAHADRSLLVNTPSQPPWKDAEPLQDSALLGRLQSFLPAMQRANEELEKAAAEEPDSCNIESVTESGPHIEMNLACGVLDLKDNNAAAAAQRAVNVANSAEAIEHLPVLKEDEDDLSTKPAIWDMSRTATGADGNLITERASRRMVTPNKDHTENGYMGARSEALCSLERTGDHSVAASESRPMLSKPGLPSSTSAM